MNRVTADRLRQKLADHDAQETERRAFTAQLASYTTPRFTVADLARAAGVSRQAAWRFAQGDVDSARLRKAAEKLMAQADRDRGTS